MLNEFFKIFVDRNYFLVEKVEKSTMLSTKISPLVNSLSKGYINVGPIFSVNLFPLIEYVEKILGSFHIFFLFNYFIIKDTRLVDFGPPKSCFFTENIVWNQTLLQNFVKTNSLFWLRSFGGRKKIKFCN